MKHLDVDSMMEQLRRELGPDNAQPAAATGKLPAEEILGRARAELAARRGVTGATGEPAAAVAAAGEGPWRPAAERLPGQRAYVLADLLKFSDADFVDVAYRIVLRRSPDASGFDYYLRELRVGRLTKVEILGQLRWSAEGLARGVHIDGLLLPYTVQKWRRKRYIGPIAAWLHTFLRLGSLTERQALTEAAQAREAQEVGRALNQVAADLKGHVGQLREKASTFGMRVDAVEDGLKGKADRAAVDGLVSEIERAAGRGSEQQQLIAHLSDRLEHAEARLEAQAELERKLQMMSAVVEGMVLREEQARDASRALDQFYADFEETFRGERSIVRKRAEPYLAWVREAGAGAPDAPVLDLGCGRGEWLELLREQGLHARGIDLNRVFADSCRAMGLAVTEQDAIQGMRALPAASVGAVTSMHLVEHLPFEVLIALLDEARRIIRPGGLLALEKPNPENLTVATHTFYFDPTHRNPLPPQMLRWIVESRGFEDVRIERLSEARDLDPPEPLPDTVPGAAAMNVLIRSLGIAPDYAIVARRP